jgi:hypothetical protein
MNAPSPLPVTFVRTSALATLERSIALTTGVLNDPGHPFIGRPCVACYVPLDHGDAVALIPLGPGADAEERRKCYDGRPYNAVCLAVHAACAGVNNERT